MNRYLSNNYTLLNRLAKKDDTLRKTLIRIVSNPTYHFIIFGILMLLVSYLSINKVIKDIIPYSWHSSFAYTFAFSIASIGFCLLMGYSGLASLGTGGFIGIGCYAVHYVMSQAGLPLIVAILVAIAVAVVIGLFVGFISLRIESIYLVILTLGLSEVLRNIYRVVEDSIYFRNKLSFLGFQFKSSEISYIIIAVLVIVMIITNNLISSPTGRAMLAMKNSTAAAQAMGISLLKYRLFAFIMCTVYASVSGVMLMIFARSSMASNGTGFYALITSLNILAAVIIGGYKSIWGAVFGTFVMYGMNTSILQNIEFLSKNPELITILSGVLVIIIVMFFPGGLAQLLQELKYKIKKLIAKIREGIYGKDIG